MPHPAQTARLFPAYDDVLPRPAAQPANAGDTARDDTAGDEDVSDFVIGRLLEEGDTADLRWLLRRVPERRLIDWLEQRGSRQLSRRSQLFWRCLLGLAPTARNPTHEALWPL